MPIAWFVSVLTTHGKLWESATTEFQKKKVLREAWLARIRRVNPRDINNSCVCSAHFTPDCFERTLYLVPGYQKRPKLKSDAVPSIFPRSKPEKARSTGRRRNQIRSEQARQEVLSKP